MNKKVRQKLKETVDINFVTGSLSKAVEELSQHLKSQSKFSALLYNAIIARFDLFQALNAQNTQTKDDSISEDIIRSVFDIAAYLQVNQILFYELAAVKIGLPPIKEIANPKELNQYFEGLSKFGLTSFSLIPVFNFLEQESTPLINKIILSIQQLKIENISHDLIGRLFHESLPFETRKQLATFYTNPVAAEILAGISIENTHQKIVDPACGSGTLLVSALRFKKEIFKSGISDKNSESEIFGLDIMPFAAHIANLNLQLQELPNAPGKLQVGVGNALEIFSKNNPSLLCSNFDNTNACSAHRQLNQSISNNVDLVIMNPPYTDRKWLLDDMLGDFEDSFEYAQNYWAYFIKLADEILTNKGRIAAVLPRLFLAGSSTKELRKWLFKEKRYTLRYIVKTCQDSAFSEAARFRDYLIVLDKGESDVPCQIVYLKKSLKATSLAEARKICGQIRTTEIGKDYSNGKIEVAWVSQKKIRENFENLGSLVGFESAKNIKILSDKWETVASENVSNISTLDQNTELKSIRGFEPKPAGLYNLIFLVRPNHPRRNNNSQLSFQEGNVGHVNVYNKLNKQTLTFPKTHLKIGLKTISYVNRLCVDDIGDWIVTETTEEWKEKVESGFSQSVSLNYLENALGKRETYLTVAKRINLIAPGTAAVAFYASKPINPANVMYSVVTSPLYSQGLCLWFNSVFGILQFLNLRMETEGAYCDMLLETLTNKFQVPTESFVEKNKKIVENFWDKFSDADYPSLSDQFKYSPLERVAIDEAVLKMFGYKSSAIKKMLPNLYKSLATEFNLLSQVGS